MENRTLIKEISNLGSNRDVEIFGWVRGKRVFKNLYFLDIADYTGKVQLSIKKDNPKWGKLIETAKKLKDEACVSAKCQFDVKTKELIPTEINIISNAKIEFSPKPSSQFDIFNHKYNENVFNNRHVYIRNPKIAAAFRIRNTFIQELHKYLQEKDMIEFATPMFTDITLYQEDSAFDIDFYGKKLFLNQCSAFYLESAVPVFERVYFISPSFRREPSKDKRHLSEYWHLKGELAFYNLEEIMKFTEDMIYKVYTETVSKTKDDIEILEKQINAEYFKPPYKLIEYNKAIELLNSEGFKIEYGASLGNDEELFLGKKFKSPLWIKYLPRSVEPFPYRINQKDPRSTLTADMLIPGYGEVLGVAEKIYDINELRKRQKEDFVPNGPEVYKWYNQLREYGLPPHSGFGMGLERALRVLLQLNHVKDIVPYPRLYSHLPYP